MPIGMCLMFQCVNVMILQDLLAQEKAQSSTSFNQEVDLDELMDVSLMKLSVF